MSGERLLDISQLEARKERLRGILAERESLYLRVGTCRIKEEDSPIKVGETRARLRASQARIESRVVETQEEIDRINLIKQAESYLSLVDKKRRDLEKILSLREHLSPATVERYERDYKALLARPGEDPELKKAVGVFKEEKRREEEERKTPKISIDIAERRVRVKIRETIRAENFTETIFRTFLHLQERINQDVPSAKIAQVIQNAPGNRDLRPFEVVNIIWRCLEPNPENPQLITSSGRGSKTNYQLHGEVIEIKNYPTSRSEIRTQESSLPTPDSRLVALVKIIRYPKDTTLEEILEILGPSRKGHVLSWQQATRSLQRTIAHLLLRVGKGDATETELETWQTVKSSTGKSRNDFAAITVKGRLARWFEGRKPAKKEAVLKEINPVKLQALEQILEDDTDKIGLAEILSLLPKTKKGKTFLWIQARRSLRVIATSLYARAVRSTQAEDQARVWGKIKDMAGREISDRETLTLINHRVYEWFETRRRSS